MKSFKVGDRVKWVNGRGELSVMSGIILHWYYGARPIQVEWDNKAIGRYEEHDLVRIDNGIDRVLDEIV